MSKAKDTMDSALDKLKKEIEKEQMNAERIRALVDAVTALNQITGLTYRN